MCSEIQRGARSWDLNFLATERKKERQTNLVTLPCAWGKYAWHIFWNMVTFHHTYNTEFDSCRIKICSLQVLWQYSLHEGGIQFSLAEECKQKLHLQLAWDIPLYRSALYYRTKSVISLPPWSIIMGSKQWNGFNTNIFHSIATMYIKAISWSRGCPRITTDWI